jgi:hypothetical protein
VCKTTYRFSWCRDRIFQGEGNNVGVKAAFTDGGTIIANNLTKIMMMKQSSKCKVLTDETTGSNISVNASKIKDCTSFDTYGMNNVQECIGR